MQKLAGKICNTNNGGGHFLCTQWRTMRKTHGAEFAGEQIWLTVPVRNGFGENWSHRRMQNQNNNV